VEEIAIKAERGVPYDVADGRRRFMKLRRHLIAAAVESRPTYVTSEMTRHPLLRPYHLLPEGLATGVALEDDGAELAPLRYAGPGMTADGLRDGREQEIYAEYPRALRTRAGYLRSHGHVEEAAELLARATQMSKGMR
jgi:hypothetical protein